VAGSFAFTAPGTTPSAGNYSAAITFTPSNTNNYNTVSSTVTVIVTDNQGNAVTTGTNVTANPISAVAMMFTEVTSAGDVTVTAASVPPPPADYRILTGSSYDITTTAVYNGQILVCLNYSDAALANLSNESGIGLFHHNGTNWDNITNSVDTTNNVVCGLTNSLSPFTLGEPLTPPVTETVNVPVFNGFWLLTGIFAGLGLLIRRKF
jgi:hypothetical protein